MCSTKNLGHKMNVSVSSYLRALASLLERSDRSETYSARVHELPSLLTLVQDTLSTSGQCLHLQLRPGAGLPPPLCRRRSADSKSWFLPNADKAYALKLLKKCILTKFQVVCATKIARKDLHPVFREFAEASELFNTKVVAISSHTHHSPSNRWIIPQNHTQVVFEDFVEVYVSCHSECVSDLVLTKSTEVKDILEIARQERQFIKSLVSTFNAHSSLLHRLCVHREDTAHHTTPSQDTHRASPSRSTTDHFLEEAALEKIGLLTVSELWKEIALHLRYTVSSRVQRDKIDISKSATQQLEGDKDIAAAAKCLQYVVTTVATDQEVVEWDKGFQAMLAASQMMKANKKSCKAVEIFCNSVTPSLHNTIAVIGTRPAQLTTPSSLADHFDHLSMCHRVITPLTTSLHAISTMLVASLELSHANKSLPKLAQYIFSEAPRAHHFVCSVESEMNKVSPPMVLSPELTGWYVKEREFHTKYGNFRRTFTYMSDRLEKACVQFHDFLRVRYKQCLCSVFPTAKQWRAMGKQTRKHTSGHVSKYCDVIAEQLIMPTIEAALSLPEDNIQRLFMTLAVSILFNEYRKIITPNKHTYRVSAGRQLLVDFNHLLQQITSEKSGLLPTTVQSVSGLPVVVEIERGLQFLCGTTTSESGAAEGQRTHCDVNSVVCVRGLSSLPVWSEIASNSYTDWQECVL